MPDKMNGSEKPESDTNVAYLLRRQDQLEIELTTLRKMFAKMKESNATSIDRVHRRIDTVERELADLRLAIDDVKSTVNLIQIGVTSVQQHVSDINSKQDVTIVAQDKFISQLWKAFFALLGLITAAGGILTAILN